MQAKVIEFQREQELFRSELVNLIDERHALVKLAESLDWNAAAERFGALYAAGVGRPGAPIRLMVGPHYLKHAFNLSEELVVERWVENPPRTCGPNAAATLLRRAILPAHACD